MRQPPSPTRPRTHGAHGVCALVRTPNHTCEGGWCGRASDLVLGCVSHCTTVCGDGLRRGNETTAEGCDDGNLLPGDGCNASCLVEIGWNCSEEGMPCTTVCGDGYRRGEEASMVCRAMLCLLKDAERQFLVCFHIGGGGGQRDREEANLSPRPPMKQNLWTSYEKNLKKAPPVALKSLIQGH